MAIARAEFPWLWVIADKTIEKPCFRRNPHSKSLLLWKPQFSSVKVQRSHDLQLLQTWDSPSNITNPHQRCYIQLASTGLKHCSAAPKTQVCKHILHGTQLTVHHRHNLSRCLDRTGCVIVSCLVTRPHCLLMSNPATPLLPWVPHYLEDIPHLQGGGIMN